MKPVGSLVHGANAIRAELRKVSRQDGRGYDGGRRHVFVIGGCRRVRRLDWTLRAVLDGRLVMWDSIAIDHRGRGKLQPPTSLMSAGPFAPSASSACLFEVVPAAGCGWCMAGDNVAGARLVHGPTVPQQQVEATKS